MSNSNLTFPNGSKRIQTFQNIQIIACMSKITSSPTLNSKRPKTSSLTSSFQRRPPPGHMTSMSRQTTPLPICPRPLQQRTGKIRVSHVDFLQNLDATTFQIKVSFQIPGFKLLLLSTSLAPQSPAIPTSFTVSSNQSKCLHLLSTHYHLPPQDSIRLSRIPFLLYPKKCHQKYFWYCTASLYISYTLFKSTGPNSSLLLSQNSKLQQADIHLVPIS